MKNFITKFTQVRGYMYSSTYLKYKFAPIKNFQLTHIKLETNIKLPLINTNKLK